jgi:hypothetical protein
MVLHSVCVVCRTLRLVEAVQSSVRLHNTHFTVDDKRVKCGTNNALERTTGWGSELWQSLPSVK